jgi:hypothetical protein
MIKMALASGDILHKLTPSGEDELFEVIEEPQHYKEWVTVRLRRVDN